MLPAVPMLAFLMLLCGGYFVLFTAAGGQTIGKMAAHIRVVNGPEVTRLACRSGPPSCEPWPASVPCWRSARDSCSP